MKSEVGPRMWGARRGWRRKPTTPGRKVAALMSQGTHARGSSWQLGREAFSAPAWLNLDSSYRGLHGAQAHKLLRWSQSPLPSRQLSPGCTVEVAPHAGRMGAACIVRGHLFPTSRWTSESPKMLPYEQGQEEGKHAIILRFC